MTYAPANRAYYDADSHIMELPNFLKDFADPALRGPVEDYLRREMAAVEEEMEWLSEAYSPFRQSGDA